MTIDEMIAVLQGAKEGKQVQCRRRTTQSGEWLDAVSACWDFNDYDFRLKPEPREWIAVLYEQSGLCGGLFDSAESAAKSGNKCPYIHVREVLD